MATVAELLNSGKKALAGAKIDSAAVDAALLLGHILDKSRTELFLAGKEEVAERDEDVFYGYIKRRLQREPAAYILGTREFWSLPFQVSDRVLIPRPETEFLLEKVFSLVDKNVPYSVLDLCCGSGVIACVLALELDQPVTAADISEPALQVAKKNAELHGVDQKIHFIHSDLFENLEQDKKYSLIVSNPPYVSTLDLKNNLEPEVSVYEPALALDGGKDGLDIIIIISEKIGERLAEHAHFFMELGAEQGRACREIFKQTGLFSSVKIHQDYSGRDRVLHAYR